jgi:hypothetical protein
VRASVAGAARLGITDSTTTTYGSYHTGGGAYETLSVTATVASGTTSLIVAIWFSASGTYDVDSAVLVVGSAAPSYAPLHPADDLIRCQRHYHEIGGLDTNEYAATGFCFGATNALFVVRYPVEMLGAPTVTVSAPGDWIVHNASGTALPCTALGASALTRRSARLTATVASGLVAGNATSLVANTTAAARIRFESNP